MMNVDTPTLANLITTCFNLSMDGRLNDAHQREFLIEGKRLRGCLINLLTARFNDGTQQVLTANQQLAQVNQQTLQLTNNLANAANVLAQINAMVVVLDQLLQLAASFH
jgi:hypothetical protein